MRFPPPHPRRRVQQVPERCSGFPHFLCFIGVGRTSGVHHQPLQRPRRPSYSLLDQRFAEPVTLSSTSPVDFPLPRTALRRGFVLLALRARRKRQPSGQDRSVQGHPEAPSRSLRAFSLRPFRARTGGRRVGRPGPARAGPPRAPPVAVRGDSRRWATCATRFCAWPAVLRSPREHRPRADDERRPHRRTVGHDR